MALEKPKILVLYWYPNRMRPAIRHHLAAMRCCYPPEQLLYFNGFQGFPPWLAWHDYDAIILHNTLLCTRWSASFSAVQEQIQWIRHANAVKIAIPQDEYDHAELLDEWLYSLNVSDIFTNFSAETRHLLYPIMHRRARFHRCFTGYIDSKTAAQLEHRLLPIKERSLDLVYRAAHLPFWFGRQGQLKHNIADVVLRAAEKRGFRCDISTRDQDAITADCWFDFLGSSRAVLGIESGSSVLDRRGEVRAAIQHMLAANPELTFEEISRRLPPNWDDSRFFALGPRHFEAVYTGTVQVLVEGAYDDVLVPNRHYLPLRRDFANLPEVLDTLGDHRRLENIAANAYQDIYKSGRYTYSVFAQQIRHAIEQSPGTLRRNGPRVWIRRLAANVAQSSGGLRKSLLRSVNRQKQVVQGTATLARASFLRTVLFQWLRSPAFRTSVNYRQLLREVLVLKAATQVSGVVNTYNASLSVAGTTLHFRSGPVATGNPLDWTSLETALQQGKIRRFVWSRDDFKDTIRLNLGGKLSASYDVGDEGDVEFPELARLLVNHPATAWNILHACLGPYVSRPSTAHAHS